MHGVRLCPRLVGMTLLLATTHAAAAPLFDYGGDSFRKGLWVVEADGAFIQPLRFSDDEFYQATFAASYYIADDVSVGAEVSGFYVDQPNDDTAALSAGLLLRWHFLQAERFTLFVDGGFGVSVADAAVPEGGTHFNYTPKGGVGATILLRDDLHLIGGVRFFHQSNANIHGREQNPSFDGAQYYLGVLFTL